MNTRSSPVTGSVMTTFPRGAGSTYATDPLVPRPPGITCQPQTYWNACARTQRRDQLDDWGRTGEVSGLLDIDPGIAVTLVQFGIGVTLKIGESQPRAVGR